MWLGDTPSARTRRESFSANHKREDLRLSCPFRFETRREPDEPSVLTPYEEADG